MVDYINLETFGPQHVDDFIKFNSIKHIQMILRDLINLTHHVHQVKKVNYLIIRT